MEPKYEQICRELVAEFPKFKVIPKGRSWFMLFLYIVAFMYVWNREFMTRFTTVIGTTVYMPEGMIGTLSAYTTLRHERVHMRDAKGWRFLYYAPSYLFLPIGPSFRAYWEFRGYQESMRAYLETYGDIPDDAVEFWAECFYGPKYMFMWPFKNHIRGVFYRYRDELTNGNQS